MKMKAPKGFGGCSFAGVEYPVSKRIVDVPDEAIDELRAHGFVCVGDADPDAAADAAGDANAAA